MSITIRIIIPGIAKRDLADYNILFNNELFPLGVTVYLIAWRAQISATLASQMDTPSIQQLESMRFIARQLSTNYQVKRFAAAIAVNRTFGFYGLCPY